MSDTQSLLLFATDAADSARMEAIDQLHEQTSIYTAEKVVDQLLEHIDWPSGQRRLLEPSCGDGSVIGRALTKALSERAFTDAELPRFIEGWEIHPFACEQARSRVASILISFGRSAAVARNLAEQIILNRDFLTEGPTVPSFDAVIGNPPYLRKANVPELLRSEYEHHVPKYASQDLMHAFVDRASLVLREHGKIAVIVSDRILINPSAGALREAVGARVAIEHVERLCSESSFYRPKTRRKGTPARVHPLLLVMSGAGNQVLGKDPIYPGVESTKYAAYPQLQEVAQVRLAPWPGPFGIFVLPADEANAKGLPSDVLVPAIDTDDIEGDKLLKPKRVAIRTNPDDRPCEAVMKHLQETMHKMPPRGLGSTFWCPPERFHSWNLDTPMLLVPRIVHRPKAVMVPPGTLPLNHNLSVICTNAGNLEKIKRAIEGDVAAEWLLDHAARLEGGYLSITPNLLKKMPIDLR